MASLANWVFEPVVKSEYFVPRPMIKSAFLAYKLAIRVPVTPIPPKFCFKDEGIELFPAWVKLKGIFVFLEIQEVDYLPVNNEYHHR